MENSDMGRVVVEAIVENLRDAWEVERGALAANDARKVTIDDALVDTGASSFSLQRKYVQALGLKKVGEKPVRTSAGPRVAALFEAVRLTIQGREMTVDVLEVDDDVPTLIGQIPLEYLDFVVDPRDQRLVGNPAHGGEQVFEMY